MDDDALLDLEQVRYLVSELAQNCEEMWLEREGCRMALARFGCQPSQIREFETLIKSDPDLRASARQAFAGMWKAIEDSGKDALFADLLQKNPPKGEAN